MRGFVKWNNVSTRITKKITSNHGTSQAAVGGSWAQKDRRTAIPFNDVSLMLQTRVQFFQNELGTPLGALKQVFNLILFLDYRPQADIV